ncbi:acetylcholine receptor subunit delta-like [Patella vulgata]|uniref:acetylcholine receptor subunit delta-like n=1 Tax=Patella vulgata TaxID=6465 RepID=UPI00217F6972|nr:acetylcholine receptor subunit delta-like [Patella vulgata]
MPIRLNTDGTVLWTPSILFQTSCDINVKYYPFDQQVCSITLETMFALPADSGEKISLAVTILLGYILFLSILSSEMPQTSLEVSVLAVYISLKFGR